MAKQLFRKALKSLKKHAAVCTLALSFAAPNAQAAEPASPDGNRAVEDEQAAKPSEFSFSLDGGYSRNTLMGRDFSSGFYEEANADAGIPLTARGSLEIDGRFKAEGMKFARRGSLDNLGLELGAMFVIKNNCSSFKPYIGFGANLEITASNQNFEGSAISISNINTGPMIKLGIDSKSVDVGLEYRLGFGEAGNTVHGRGRVIKHHAKAGLGIEVGPVRVEGYGEGKANMLEIKTVNRNDYHFSAGAKAAVKVTDSIALEAGYEHGWVFGNLDNIEEDIFKGGLKVRF